MLNTIVVGLDAVEKGHEKPVTLDVRWEPEDRVLAARTARKFAVESFLVRAAEAQSIYIRAIASLPRFDAIRSFWDQTTGAADRVDQVGQEVLGPGQLLVSSGTLLVVWRNAIVHKGEVKLSPKHKRVFRDHEESVKESYRNLSLERLIVHAVEGKPTLKDVSSLIAMTINLARAIDADLHSSLTKADVAAWLAHYEIVSAIQKVRRETKLGRVEASIANVFRSKAPQLYPQFLRFFQADGSDFL